MYTRNPICVGHHQACYIIEGENVDVETHPHRPGPTAVDVQKENLLMKSGSKE